MVVEKPHRKRIYRTGFVPGIGPAPIWRLDFYPGEIFGNFLLPIDKRKSVRYNGIRREIASRNTIRWRLLLFVSRGDLTPLRSPEGSGAYDPDHSTLFFTMVTYEALFALGMLIIAIIELCSRKR